MRADITDLCFRIGDDTVVVGVIAVEEFVTRDDTRKITAFVDGRKRIMEIGDIFGMSGGAGCMCKLNIGIFLGSLQDVGLVTEAVRKDEIATVVDKVNRSIVAFCRLGNIGPQNEFDTEIVARLSCGVDKVLVICAVFAVQADETELEIGAVIARDERDCDGCHERQNKHKCQNLFLHSYLRILCLSAY